MRGAYSHYLAQRETQGRPIRLGLAGVGQMGTGIVAQSRHIPGLSVLAVAELDVERAQQVLQLAGHAEPVISEDADRATRELLDGRVVVCRDAELLAQLPLDVVIEATGVPEVGARMGIACALHGRHLVSMNVEADATIGRFLRHMFDLSGAVYTLAAGDEPSAIFDLVDFARTVGLDVVAAGKGKNNPLRPRATAAEVKAEAARKHMNPKMLAAFVDGTKTMCEMTVLSNATGYPPDVPGMHGPRADARELATVFRPISEGGVLKGLGVVDYVTGDVAPGVFVIVRTEDRTVSEDLRYLKVGAGPYWALIRPYHLANLEVPISIVRVMRDGYPTLVSSFHAADVVAVAKRRLQVGDLIRGIGGDEVYGQIWPADEAEAHGFVPIGLTEGALVRAPVEADTPLSFDDLELQEGSVLLRAWRLQQHMDELKGDAVQRWPQRAT